MSEPKLAEKNPIAVELEPGIYWWCACGESSKQPFCDGSHKAKAEFRPLSFEIEDKKKVWLCACKRTKNQPYCDGSHKDL